ncbi:MAG TPA: TIGR03960 family B12-binding radical SAM protein [Polyangiaceae bacterium]|nr:TIGR03960 family B12-binding radical SAM protein [Polyangiaceae bacterium]
MPGLHRHPYADFVHRVQKPARYLGGELGARVKDFDATDARVCLAFPDIYDIGMSHLGFKILYKILNDHPRILAERCFAPWVDMQDELRARGLPLVSLETAHALSEFDVIGFSLQFELTYSNILTMLDLGGVPLRAADRGEDHPLVLAGGPSATHPEPIAPFMDAIVIGDGEERATEVALLWTDLRKKGVSRTDRLRALAGLQGVYVPSLYAVETCAETGALVVAAPTDPTLPFPIVRSLVDDLNRFPFPDDGPVGGPEAIFDRMSIEIARGCTEGCRFCQAGMIYRPVRERDPDQIVETVASAVKKSGYDEASLTSLSTADYSCIAPLIKKVADRLAPEKVALGVSSLRAYGLEEDVLDDMTRVRAQGVTFAPEAGSQRMRDVVNKNVTEEQLQTTAERIFSRNYASMKLYFMIGLPTEQEDDVREIVRVGARTHDTGKRLWKARGKFGAPKVTVSVSTHVPKPHTPFQYCAMDAPDTVRQKQEWLRSEVRGTGVDLRMHDSETSWLEGVFARGDRRLGAVLERAYRLGARFDSWEDQLRLDLWEEAFRAEGVDPGLFLGTIPTSARLPWDHIDVGLEEGFLAREYRKALKSRLSVPCGKAAGMFIHHTNLEDAKADPRKLVCYDCGVACDLSAMREERLVLLSRLGAEKRRSRTEAEVAAIRAKVPKGRKPPPRIVQGEGRRVRFAYEKLGPSAFLSHLDLVRAIPRAFRRIDVPMFYSSGFHPKPDMVFGPALSLGVYSLDEYLDLKLTCDVDEATLAERLSAVSQDGLRFTGVRVLGPNDAGVNKLIAAARYVLAFPTATLPGGVDFLRARAAHVIAAEEQKILRKIEGIGKWIDVKRFLTGLRVEDPSAGPIVARAGLGGSLVTVLVDVAITNAGAVKAHEVAEVLLGEGARDTPYAVVRAAMGGLIDGALVSPLELERFRKAPPAREPLGAPAAPTALET